MKLAKSSVGGIKGLRWMALSAMCASLAACGTTHAPSLKRQHGKEYFSEAEYGVKASPRVVTNGPIPSGGGRYMVGNPYQVKGKWYYPREDFSYNKVGIASWYGSAFHGRLTANGEVYDQLTLSAAHPTFPLPSYARVTNVADGSSIVVRVNDRGPYHPGRIIDLSNKTADLLNLRNGGTGAVRVQYVGRAPLEGHDMPYLMASYVPKGSRVPGINPGFGGQIATGVMVASAGRMTADQLPDYAPTPFRTPTRRPAAAPALAAAPVPMVSPTAATAFAGPTPAIRRAAPQPAMTWGGQAVPMVEPVSEPISNSGSVFLPQIGPIPYERPDFRPGYAAVRAPASSEALAYGEPAVKTVYVPLAFDAIMVRNDGLTQESILAAYKRKHQAGR